MEQQWHYVQIGTHTIRGDGDYRLAVPLYMRVSDGKAYYALRDKCLRGISQMVIEKYRERLQSNDFGGS